MKMKTQVFLALATAMGLAAIPWSVRLRNLTKARESQSELTKMQLILESDITHLRAQLSAAEIAVARQAVLTQAPDDGHAYIAVPKETLKRAGFLFFDDEFELRSVAIDILSLSSEENAALQNILFELKDQVQSRVRARTQELSQTTLYRLVGGPIFDRINSDDKSASFVHIQPADTLDTLKSLENIEPDPGEPIVAYEIPTLPEDESTALRQWLVDRVAQVLDPLRTEIFTANIAGDVRFWLVPHRGLISRTISDRAILAIRASKKINASKYDFAWADLPKQTGVGFNLIYSGNISTYWAFLFEGPDALALPHDSGTMP